MYFIYILKSENSDHIYVGQTSDLQTRLSYHNLGKVKWTSRYKPWKIAYFENFSTRVAALEREKYLKSHSGRKWIKEKFNTGS